MLLTIDCGNTNTVFTLWDAGETVCTLRTSTAHQRTADAYWVWFSTLMKHHGVEPNVTGVIISSTVPRVVFNLRVFTDRFFGLRPLVVGREDCLLPIEVRVDAGTAVGPDRLGNTVAGVEHYRGGLV
ncbi:MAG TPA: pantothenate kinase, partial [Maritimibacter sp.]|nr:pantothenate kinase [Maritimibacter sp.]